MTRTIDASTTPHGRREPCEGCTRYHAALGAAADELRAARREHTSWLVLAVGGRVAIERRRLDDQRYGIALERRERALICDALDGKPVNLHALESDARRDLVEAILTIRQHGAEPTRERILRVVRELAAARATVELDAVVELTLSGGSVTRIVDADGEETIVAIERWGGDSLRVRSRTYEGKPFADVRIFDGAGRPTPRGTSIRVSEIQEVIGALTKALDRIVGNERAKAAGA